jgi:hypothetical protein
MGCDKNGINDFATKTVKIVRVLELFLWLPVKLSYTERVCG